MKRLAVPSFRRWSNNRQSRAGRLAAAALLAAAGAALGFGPALAPAAQAAVGVAVAAAAAVFLRTGWLKLFGPVLFYDLVRTARRRPLLVVRFLYVACLAALFFLLACAELLAGHEGPHELFARELRASEVSRLTESYFHLFVCAQFAAVFLLTPVTVAGAIAEERQRRTLEFLLATDLRDQEIVLGTWAGRLAGLLLILLGGVPILFLTLSLGGVDPLLLLGALAATLLSVVSLASLSILNSVLTRRPLDAILRTYLMAAAFLVLSAGFEVTLKVLPFVARGTPWANLADFPSTVDWTSPITVQDVSDWVNAGNLGTALVKLAIAQDSGMPLDSVLPGLLKGYAWFHGLFAAVCLTWAVLRLRPVALTFLGGPARRRAPAERTPLPPLGRWPMLWKELYTEGPMRRRRAAGWGINALVLLSLLPALGALGVFVYSYPFESWDGLADFLNGYARVASTAVACLLLLSVAVRAAGSVTGERDRQTLDLLLTTPLSSRAILGSKWLGAVLAVRRGWPWLFSVWALAYFGGGMDLWQAPSLAAVWLVYAAFCASLGLWVSVRCRTTTRAVLGVILGLIGMTVGHWLAFLVYASLAWTMYDGTVETGRLLYTFRYWTQSFHVYGLTPPATLDLITERTRDPAWRFDMDGEWARNSVCAVWGLGVYALAAALLWSRALRYFRKAGNRLSLQRPVPYHAEPTKLPESMAERGAELGPAWYGDVAGPASGKRR